MFLVSCTSEVNRNASMPADLLSEMCIPRFGLRRLESGRVTGIMHYVEEGSVTFSPGRAPLYILQCWLDPRQGHKDHLIYLTTIAIKLLTSFMSWSNFYTASNMRAIYFWLKVVLRAPCDFLFSSFIRFFTVGPMFQQNWIHKSNAK